MESVSLVEALIRLRWEQSQRDPLAWLQYFVTTCDQHDKANPIKPFPAERPHVRAVVQLWRDNPLLCLLKSRQMLMTWTFCALALWDAMFHPGRLIMLQSKREEDAIGNEVAGDGLMGRVKFILHHTPFAKLVLPEFREVYNKVEFPALNSTIWAIPQGASIIRQRTASGILSDEAAFQPEFGDAYVAARPCIRGGGWFVVLSTADMADGGMFRRLHEDRMGEE